MSPSQVPDASSDVTKNDAYQLDNKAAIDKALRISEMRYRRLFETAQDGIMLINADTAQIEDINPFLINMLGYTYTEFLGKKIWEVGAFKDTALNKEAFKELQDKRYIRYDDLPLVAKDGRHFSVEFVSNAYDCEGIQVIQCNIRDNTDRHLVELALIESNLKLSEYYLNLRKSLEQTIQIIAATISERDSYTAGHQMRVADLSSKIAKELDLSEEQIHGLHLAASIHDLGKISIPAEILSKPRRLTELEYSLIKEHAETGFNILKEVSFPWPIAQIIHEHHERIDGSGYPRGLKGDQLLIESKIIAVADVVEAMASHRPYRPALGIDAALHEITRQSGLTLDATVVDACLRIFNDQRYQFED